MLAIWSIPKDRQFCKWKGKSSQINKMGNYMLKLLRYFVISLYKSEKDKRNL